MGQYWEANTGVLYHITSADNHKLVLSSLIDGNRWTGPVSVETIKDITPEEWQQMTGGTRFTLVADTWEDLIN